MKKHCLLILLLPDALLLLACNEELPSSGTDVDGTTLFFDSVPVITPVVPTINEASGIADSKRNPGYLWVEEDSGNSPQLHLLGHDGNVLKSIYIKGATNRDWEDIALINDTVYIADIGDNNLGFSDYTIYQFAEPPASTDTVTSFNAIHFRYPDGAHDAEALLVRPDTKDIYIITKRDVASKIYKLSFPYSTTSVNYNEHSGNTTVQQCCKCSHVARRHKNYNKNLPCFILSHLFIR